MPAFDLGRLVCCLGMGPAVIDSPTETKRFVDCIGPMACPVYVRIVVSGKMLATKDM